MTDYYTENLAEFGYREIEMLRDILLAWTRDGLPDCFENSGVKPAMNKCSGNVFLINDDYQVAMLKNNTLEIFHSLPHSGIEGFLSELIAENKPSSLHYEDIEYIKDAATGINLDEEWLE